MVGVAENSKSDRPKPNLFQNIKQRITGARDQLATTRAKQQFRVPDPDEYPATPITQAEDFTPERPPAAPLELISRPIRTGFLLTVGVGLALAVYLLVSSNVQLLVWILAAFFITLGLDPIVTKIQSWGAPRGVGVAAAVIILLGIVTVFISTLIPVIVEQTTEFVQILPTVVSDFIASDFFRAIDDEFDVASTLR